MQNEIYKFFGLLGLLIVMSACTEADIRSAKPTDDGEGVEGYISSEKVEAGRPAKISLEHSEIEIQQDTFDRDVIVALRHDTRAAIEEVVADLGEAKAKPIEVFVIDAVTREQVSSDSVTKAIIISQLLESVDNQKNLQALIVSDPDQDSQSKVIYPKTLLTVTEVDDELALLNSKIKVSFESFAPHFAAAIFESDKVALNIPITTQVIAKKSSSGGSSSSSSSGGSSGTTDSPLLHMVWSRSDSVSNSDASYSVKYGRLVDGSWSIDEVIVIDDSGDPTNRKRLAAAFWDGAYPIIAYADAPGEVYLKKRQSTDASTWVSAPPLAFAEPITIHLHAYHIDKNTAVVGGDTSLVDKFALKKVVLGTDGGISFGASYPGTIAANSYPVPGGLLQYGAENHLMLPYDGNSGTIHKRTPNNDDWVMANIPSHYSYGCTGIAAGTKGLFLGTSLKILTVCDDSNDASRDLTYFPELNTNGDGPTYKVSKFSNTQHSGYSFAINNKNDAAIVVYDQDQQARDFIKIYRKKSSETSFNVVFTKLLPSLESNGCSFRNALVSITDEGVIHAAYEEGGGRSGNTTKLMYVSDVTGTFSPIALDQITTTGCYSGSTNEAGFYIGGLHYEGAPSQGTTF